MRAVTRDDIAAATERIAGHVRCTPVLAVEPGIFDTSGVLTLKLEQVQYAGSFKARGAFNRLLTAEIPDAGVAAASGGNFGLAIAFAARALGIPATVFVPEVSAPAKVDRLRTLGAEVVQTGAWYADALAACQEHVATTGALMPHAYDDLEVIAGAGTLGAEIAEQAPEVDTVLVAVGGGGLISGVATWFGGDVRVVGVESEHTPTITRALAANGPTDVEVSGIVADSLGAGRLGARCWLAVREHVASAVTVPDAAIRAAQTRLWDEVRIATEPAGAVPLAALMTGAYRPEPGERVVAVVCGGNVDPATVTAALPDPGA